MATHENAARSWASRRWIASQSREIAINVLVATFFLFFALKHFDLGSWWTGATLNETLRLSSILLIIKVTADVVFFLCRRLPKDVSLSLYDWAIGIGGTFFVLMFEPVASSQANWVGSVFQMAGLVLQVCAILSLNRSFGIVAADRGVQSSGLYRFVRHPLYLSYAIAYLGFVLNQFSWFNLTVYFAAALLWILRIFAEENFLQRNPRYREYQGLVPWKLIPGLF